MADPQQTPESGEERGDIIAGVDERPQRRREWAGGFRSVALPLLALAAIVLGVWYLQRGGEGATEREAGIGIVALPADKNPTGRPPAAEEGRAAPDFILHTLDGGSIRLSDLRGKVVLINFWATWCGPCRQEVPELVRAYTAERDRGLEIVAVNLQEQEDKVRDFADEFGMQFPIALDRTGEVASAYRVQGSGLPTSVFVDRQGVVRVVRYGAMTADYLRQQLAALL